MAQICNSTLSLLSTLEHLYISDRGSTQQRWQNYIENSEWLELLRPFTAVKNLYLAEGHAPRIVPALQDVIGEQITEVLPALECLFLEKLYQSGPVHKATERLVAVRQLSNHPIIISIWERGSRDDEWTGTLNLNGTRIPVRALMAEAFGDPYVHAFVKRVLVGGLHACRKLAGVPNEWNVELAVGFKVSLLDIQVWIRENKSPMVRLNYVDGTNNCDVDQLVEEIKAHGVSRPSYFFASRPHAFDSMQL